MSPRPIRYVPIRKSIGVQSDVLPIFGLYSMFMLRMSVWPTYTCPKFVQISFLKYFSKVEAVFNFRRGVAPNGRLS